MKNKVIMLFVFAVLLCSACYPLNREKMRRIQEWTVSGDRLKIIAEKKDCEILHPIGQLLTGEISRRKTIANDIFELSYVISENKELFPLVEPKKILTFLFPKGETSVYPVQDTDMVLHNYEAERTINNIYRIFDTSKGLVVGQMESNDPYWGRFSPDYRIAYCFNSGRLVRYDVPKKIEEILPATAYNIVKQNWDQGVYASSIDYTFYIENKSTRANTTSYSLINIATGQKIRDILIDGRWDLLDIKRPGEELFFMSPRYKHDMMAIFDHKMQKIKQLVYSDVGINNYPEYILDVNNQLVYLTSDFVFGASKNEMRVVVWDYKNDKIRKIKLLIDY